ncbi:MAG TPA: hypothetical protein VGC97_01255, partial [Pyrinomonadaceae bacterium]
MAININRIQRPADRSLFLMAAVLFPLLVFIGFSKTYYLRAAFFCSSLPTRCGSIFIYRNV